MKTALANAPELELGTGVLRPPTCEFAYPGGIETLEPQVMQVLLVLASSPGRVVSRDALVEHAVHGPVPGGSLTGSATYRMMVWREPRTR